MRADAGRTPVALWVAQRLSSVLLGPAVLVHIAVPEAWKNPAAQAVLLFAVGTHAYTGLWRLLATRGVPGTARLASALAAVLSIALGLVGLAVVISLVR